MIKTHDKNYFYKYVTADVAKIILNSLEVKCSSPLIFNDPFDSQIEIQHDINSKEELMDQMIGNICEKFKPMLLNKNPEEAKHLVLKEILQDNEYVDNNHTKFNEFYTEINEKMIEVLEGERLFCVSLVNDNLLMWSHYANDHQGAVIKLKCVPEKLSALCAAKPVIYTDKIPLLTTAHLIDGTEKILKYILDEVLLTKSLDWKYEQEWRVSLLCQNKSENFDLRSIFEEELDSIYLGCRMNPQDKDEIISIIKNKRKNVKTFEAEKDKNNFKLNFKKLSTS